MASKSIPQVGLPRAANSLSATQVLDQLLERREERNRGAEPITTPITWRGYTWAPEATVRFEDFTGRQLEAPAAAALASGLLDLPATNPERAAFLREWVRSGCAVPGSVAAVAAPYQPPET